MNCSSARTAIYPSPAQCALSVETAQALDHLRHCPECRQYFETHAEWSRLLRAKLGTEPAPEALRQRLAAEIAGRPRRAMARRFGRRAILALVLVLAVLPAAWRASRLPSRLFLQALCEDHARYVKADSQFRSSDTGAVESWFRDKTEFGVRVPAFANAELLGGRLCFLRGRKAALVFYRKQGRPVSLFQLRAHDASLAALDRWEGEGPEMRRASWQGYSFAAFQQRGVAYVFVSDLRETELLELAAAARSKTRGY